MAREQSPLPSRASNDPRNRLYHWFSGPEYIMNVKQSDTRISAVALQTLRWSRFFGTIVRSLCSVSLWLSASGAACLDAVSIDL